MQWLHMGPRHHVPSDSSDEGESDFALESEALYQSVRSAQHSSLADLAMAHSTEAVLVTNLEGEIRFVPPHAATVLGRSVAEIMKLGHIRSLFSAGDEIRNPERDRVYAGLVVGSDGVQRRVRVSIEAIVEPDDAMVYRCQLITETPTRLRQSSSGLTSEPDPQSDPESDAESLTQKSRSPSSRPTPTADADRPSLLEKTLDVLPGMVALVDAQQRYQYVNQAYQAWVGRSASEIVGCTVQDIVGQAVYAQIQGYITKVLAGDKTAFEIALPVRGSEVWRQITYVPQRDAVGRVEGFCCFIEDMTSCHLARRALEESEDRYRSVVNTMAEGVLLLNAEGKILTCNASAEQILGLSQAEMLQRTAASLNWQIIREDGSWASSEDHPPMVALRTGQPQQGIVMGILRDQRLTRWISMNARPLSREGAVDPYGVLCSFSDITDLQNSTLALRDQQDLLQTILNHIPIMLVRFSQDGQIEFVNRQAEETLGWSLPEMPSIDWLMECCPEPEERKTVAKILQTANGQWYDLRLCVRDGRVLNVAWANVQLSDGSYLGIGQDISDRKQVEQALRRRAERDHLVWTLTRRIRRSLDQSDVLSTTVQEIRQSLKADRVIICRLKPANSAMVVVEDRADAFPSMMDWVLHDSWLTGNATGRVAPTRSVRAIADIYDAILQPDQVEFMAFFQIRAKLVLPIVVGENLWGFLAVHQCQMPRHWQVDEIELLQQVVTQVAIAIQQAELYQQVQDLNADLEHEVDRRTRQLQVAFEFEAVLKRIADKVRDSLDEAQILQTAVEELTTILGVRGCNASLYDLTAGTSTIYYECTTPSLLPAKGRTAQIAAYPELYSELLAGQDFQFCSLKPHPLRGRVSLLACPLQDDQGVLGDLWLINHPSYGYSEQDVRLVQQVANQCAIALRQARLYQESQAQVAELERLNQMKDDFLSTVSHELRTPMSSIKMAIQMLQVFLERKGLLTETENGTVDRYFKILNDECQREIKLINDLLDLSRLDSGRVELVESSVDLRYWLAAIAEPFEERTHNQQIQLQIQVESDVPPFMTDLSYLERILGELLNNACKYTPAEETISVTARVVAVEDAHRPVHELDQAQLQDMVQNHQVDQQPDALTTRMIQLVVCNTGVEIAPGEQSRVFDKFYRIPNSDPWKHGGTGLGLALVQKLVARLGGSIRLESADRSTSFVVHLPLALPQSQASEQDDPCEVA